MLNPADTAFLETLAAALPEGVISAAEPRYLAEPRGRVTGQAGGVARPRSAEDVSVILAACNAARVGVIPFGGGTGLVVAQVRPDGPPVLVLSLERMRAVRAVHPSENVMVVEAGATLAEVQAAAEEAGRLFPLSLASQGSAHIGGNLATNAGGVNVLRYGNTRDLCLGLEAVLPDGTIWHGLKRLRKDNTGYDLRNLLIGAEGTLGVITAASLKLSPIPAAIGTALMVVPSPAAALELLALAQSRLGGLVSAFELISGMGLSFLAETMPEQRQPFAQPPEWMVLIDVGLPDGLDPDAALAGLFEAAAEAGLVLDGVIAQSQAQRAEFWSVRENIPEGNRRIGSISSHDISLPLGEVAGFIAAGAPALATLGDFRINCFGHLGDGNLHYNVFPKAGETRADHENSREAIKTMVHDMVHARGGSVSAEHGIGRLKVEDLEKYGDPAKLAAMRAIKAALDPMGIMNPGAVLREAL
ncbi:FAD-binding oxidoreductase (plasmid) [Pseudorhodobacter turbinis]|uniref:FAD-binding oxidoreductase n=1 Tax=Pseudorhodobacter turbinis TaxID=2500533 RepID=A0A4P8ELG0_9RHOB|nr:FAD-binding oxidoreductase [Pseudorhodobacter turbinis]QCO57906.1 FAD-binding oxidoreductase [Pseudorhodobacter turbinis]